MKKTIIIVALFNSFIQCNEDQRITFDSPIIKVADGKFITANDIEAIRFFRGKIIDLLLGVKQNDNNRKGKYKFLGNYHGIQSLATLEQNMNN